MGRIISIKRVLTIKHRTTVLDSIFPFLPQMGTFLCNVHVTWVSIFFYCPAIKIIIVAVEGIFVISVIFCVRDITVSILICRHIFITYEGIITTIPLSSSTGQYHNDCHRRVVSVIDGQVLNLYLSFY